MQRMQMLAGVALTLAAVWCAGQPRLTAADDEFGADAVVRDINVVERSEDGSPTPPVPVAPPNTLDHWVTAEVHYLPASMRAGQRTSSWDELRVDWVVPFQNAPDSSNPFRFVAIETAPSAHQPFEASRFSPGFRPEADEEPAAPAGTLTLPVTTISEGVTSDQIAFTAAPDLGAVLSNSRDVQTIGAQQRSPVAFDPHIRGYRYGQIYASADGAFWWPMRYDLDTMLTKIDPWLIRELEVIPGPYGLRYGPGFSFINVSTFDTLRFDCPESHVNIGYSILTNGGQNNGRATVYGGSQDWGYIFSYGIRAGADYHPGGDAPLSRIPAQYELQNFLGQFGVDMPEDARLEFRAIRMDGNDIEYAAQIFDIDNLVTDAYQVTYVKPDPSYGGDLRISSWYNRSRFNGSFPPLGTPSDKRLPTFSVVDRIESALTPVTGDEVSLQGNTNGDLTSTGARLWRTLGDPGDDQLRFGTDFTWIEQHILENYDATLNGQPFSNDFPFYTNMPRSQMVYPGMFGEWTYHWSPEFQTSVGGRLDWVHTRAQFFDERIAGFPRFPDGVRDNTSLGGNAYPVTAESLPQNDTLYAFYVMSDYALNPEWNMRFGAGHAQRVPTLTERYADGLFLGIIQNGFSRVIGDPHLDKERNWQLDLTFTADYEQWRGRASMYMAWINDYVTYRANPISDPSGARVLLATNTDLATLGGFELYGEYDVRRWLTAFASLNYVEGRDREIDAALPQIIPLWSRAGLRVKPVTETPTWGVELAAWMVNQQNRIGYLRSTAPGRGPLIPVEEPTPGFTIFYVRGYWNVTERLNIIGGVENLFDRTYLTHLNLRLPNQGQFVNSTVFSPGITPYVGVEWTY
jgi:iron complex outermembrane recepter protein